MIIIIIYYIIYALVKHSFLQCAEEKVLHNDMPVSLDRAAPVNHAPLLLHSWVEGYVIVGMTIKDGR